MALFDRYIAVDWSAHNGPKTGRDSIWIGETRADSGACAVANPPTRHRAMLDIASRLEAALAAGERVLLGFDFAFGYPAGAAETLCGTAGWAALWRVLAAEIDDDDANRSNRFLAAGRLNGRLGPDGARYWGHPWQHRYESLTPRRPDNNHARVAERRLVESRQRNAQPVWKLSGAGAVGSQALLGIPRLEQLRHAPALVGRVAIWPFETGFADRLAAPLVIAEIFPSLLPLPAAATEVRDRLQVIAMAELFRAADASDRLGDLLSAPPDLTPAERDSVLAEEGWIVGVGHAPLLAHFAQTAA